MHSLWEIDHTMPLRMQGRRRSNGQRHRLEVTGMLWKRALKDRGVWRRATQLGLLAAAGRFLFELANPAVRDASAARVLGCVVSLGVVAFVAALIASAGTLVRMQAARNADSRN